jgi:hypothetical protein
LEVASGLDKCIGALACSPQVCLRKILRLAVKDLLCSWRCTAEKSESVH